ncbi:hypothetical protein OI71_19900 [Aeromonas hydrophila]|nr:hypothetical protein OI71_19900 [Aeromonas hydrophila]
MQFFGVKHSRTVQSRTFKEALYTCRHFCTKFRNIGSIITWCVFILSIFFREISFFRKLNCIDLVVHGNFDDVRKLESVQACN